MLAYDATVHIEGVARTRSVALADFFLLPGSRPDLENVLEPGDLITHISLPARPAGERSCYLKLRDRASYEFALASAAVVIAVDNGKIAHARVAMGGVGTKPWRSPEAEQALQGQAPNEHTFASAAVVALRDAKPQSENGFKVELARRCLAYALSTVAA